MKRFTQYFTEAKSKNNDCFKIFQNTLFGSILGKKEKDTEAEEKISDALENFVIGNLDTQSKAGVFGAFKQLKKCTKHFPKELTPEKNILYRGSPMQITRFRKNILKANVDKKGNITGTMKWKARGSVQSWSTKRNPTEQFAKNFVQDDLLSIIIKAKFSQKDLLFSSKFLEKFKGKVGGSIIENEYEIIRISDKEIKVEFELLDTVFDLRKTINRRISFLDYKRLMESMNILPWLYVIQTDDPDILDFLEDSAAEGLDQDKTKKLGKNKYGILSKSTLVTMQNLGGDFKIIEKGPGAK